MNNCRAKKAQSTIEYAMVIACVVAAFLLMQHYVKRATQGRLRDAADSIGEQYDARYIDSRVTTTQSGTTTIVSEQIREPSGEAESGRIDGVRTQATVTDTTNKTGYEQLQAFPGGLYD